MLNTILAKRVNHIVAKGGNPVWPKGSKSRGFSTCVQKDDMALIYEKAAVADMLVIASPVYFYGLSAQLKSIIDRFHNPIRDTFHIKKMALLLVGAATLPELFDSILAEYQLCLNFFKLEDSGKVLARGCKDKGDINRSGYLDEAIKLGETI